jgi:hypothetical protein
MYRSNMPTVLRQAVTRAMRKHRTVGQPANPVWTRPSVLFHAQPRITQNLLKSNLKIYVVEHNFNKGIIFAAVI